MASGRPCEQCGRRCGPDKCRTVEFSQKSGPAGRAGEPTETKTRLVCLECAAQRDSTEKSIVQAVLFVLGGLVVLRLLVAWLG
ncbi:hypothetical protein Pla123a_28630 [Posidoniimonas polymericola]|uniref:Uncharacterized protein n=1 Tax=Posidoniimonas polymericola TaxID=2528002 RepID=A0A5C5YMI6_9BACT|nr:hypothetical protein [Posidoniimonas polymericola]TWT76076.1 hypothetical protein Pla123a_28630 [Posidoniimonas polymericola]